MKVIMKRSEWDALEKGDDIELLDDGVVLAGGIVDDFTQDREIMWLIPSRTPRPSSHYFYVEGRRMMHRADGWDIARVVVEQYAHNQGNVPSQI
jgi:hypothetical protein